MRSVALLLVLSSVLAGCAAVNRVVDSYRGGPEGPVYALDCAPRADWNESCSFRASHGPGPKEEVWAAVDPKDPRNVVVAAKDLNPATSDHCVWNGIFVTKDGGASWTDVHIGGNFSDRQPGDPTYGYACNTDPDMAFAPDGTLYYAVEMYQYDATKGVGVPAPLPVNPVPGGSEFLLAASRDGGLTWPQVTRAEVGDGNVAFHDYSRLAVSPATGTVGYATGTYESYTGALPGAGPQNGVYITVVTSHDGGRTPDPPILLRAASPPASGTINIDGLVAAPDGAFLAFGYDPSGQVYRAVSTDDARTFSDLSPVFAMKPIAGALPHTKFRVGSSAEFAFDRRSGALYAVWADNRTGNPDVVAARSADKGATWTQPVRVNDDDGANAQWMANVAVTDDGVVHALFMDRRYDPGDRLIDLTYAYSVDQGRTWRNARVTNQSFDGDLGVHQGGFPFIGDYLGLAATGHDVWGGFPDCATGACVVAAVHAKPGS